MFSNLDGNIAAIDAHDTRMSRAEREFERTPDLGYICPNQFADLGEALGEALRGHGAIDEFRQLDDALSAAHLLADTFGVRVVVNRYKDLDDGRERNGTVTVRPKWKFSVRENGAVAIYEGNPSDHENRREVCVCFGREARRDAELIVRLLNADPRNAETTKGGC